MIVKIDDHAVSKLVAESLIESAQDAVGKKDRKALYRAAAYYMTFQEGVAFFGVEKAREYWDEY
jgi:hypothetical protein